MSRMAMICSLLLSLALAARVAPPALADDKTSPTPTIRPGTPLSASELGQLLDAQVWKFQVELPPDAARFSARLTVRGEGKDVRPFAAGMEGLIIKEAKRDVLIALIPINGSLRDADKVRVVVTALGMTVAQIEDNPLKGLGTGRHEMPIDQKDGSFALIGGYKGHTIGSPISSADTVISWKIETSGG